MVDPVKTYLLITFLVFVIGAIISIASRAGEPLFEDFSWKWSARIALAGPVWPVLIFAAVAWLLRTLIRNAKGHDDA